MKHSTNKEMINEVHKKKYIKKSITGMLYLSFYLIDWTNSKGCQKYVHL